MSEGWLEQRESMHSGREEKTPADSGERSKGRSRGLRVFEPLEGDSAAAATGDEAHTGKADCGTVVSSTNIMELLRKSRIVR